MEKMHYPPQNQDKDKSADLPHSARSGKWGQIDGVLISPRQRLFDDRGGIIKMLRKDDPEFKQFGEIYFSQVYPSVVKAWHLHKEMTLNYLLLQGSIRLVLHDARHGSKTEGQFQEIVLHEQASSLVQIPPGIWNGFKGLGTVPSVVANCATHPHSKEEIDYLDPYSDQIPYDWSQRHG